MSKYTQPAHKSLMQGYRGATANKSFFDRDLEYPSDAPVGTYTFNDIPAISLTGGTGNPFTYTDDTYAMVVDLYDNLVSKHSSLSKSLLATSIEGEKIYTYTSTPQIIGYDRSSKKIPIISINGAVHGNENTAVCVVYYTIKRILESSDPICIYLRSNFIIKVHPVLNPDDFNNKRYVGDRTAVWPDPTFDGNGNRDWLDNRFFLPQNVALRDLLIEEKDQIFIHFDVHNMSSRTVIEKGRLFYQIYGSNEVSPPLRYPLEKARQELADKWVREHEFLQDSDEKDIGVSKEDWWSKEGKMHRYVPIEIGIPTIVVETHSRDYDDEDTEFFAAARSINMSAEQFLKSLLEVCRFKSTYPDENLLG